MKNRFFSLLLVITMMFSCSSNKKKVMLIGEKIDPSLMKEYEYYDDTFLLESMYIKNLYFICEENAKDKNSKKTFNDLIKKSDSVVISIGLSDVLLNVCNGKVDTSTNIFENRLEMFEFYLYEIFIDIIDYSNKVHMMKIVYVDDNIQGAIDIYNGTIMNLCKEFGIHYDG